MPDYAEAIKKITAGKYAPLYLFFGEEKYLQEDLLEQLKASFLGADSQYGCLKLDGATAGPGEIIEALAENSLFSRRLIVVLENPPYFSPPAKPKEREESTETDESQEAAGSVQSEMLADYFRQMKPETGDAILVIRAKKVDKRKKIYKALAKNGVVVECGELKGGPLRNWLNAKVSRLNLKISRGALERLLLAENQNLHYLASELEKYAVFIGEKKPVIDEAVVEQLLAGGLQSDVFKLTDALAENNIAKADLLLQTLFGRRENALQILFMLARQYRLLLKTRCLLDEGIPPAQYPAVLEVHPFVARLLREQAAHFNRKTLEDIIILLQENDFKIKTGLLEAQAALSLLIRRIVYQQKAAL